MNKIAPGRLLIHYLKDRRKIIYLFIINQLIFFVVCGLYQLDNLSQIFYALWLMLFISLCCGIWDFKHYKKSTDQLYEAYMNIENILELLPEARHFQETTYQRIVNKLSEERQQFLFDLDQKRSEMADYYTLWAHQIKIPIAAVKLLLQNEEKHSVSYELLEELFKIEQYVEMVLHYVRLESIASDMILKEYDLRSIVSQAAKKYAISFINSKLSFSLEAFSFTVVTDEKWLVFVIEQLISNALKYTTSGGVSIYMESQQGRHLLVIKDTGIGIRKEDLPRIFERGFTGFNGRFDKKSTGIGLYLCKQVLGKLSHKIQVFSEVGKGTKVCIDFSKQDF